MIFRFVFTGTGLNDATGIAPYCSPKFSIAASPVRSNLLIASQDMKFIKTFSASRTKKPPLAF